MKRVLAAAVLTSVSLSVYAEWGSVSRFESLRDDIEESSIDDLAFAPTKRTYISYTGSGLKFSDDGSQYMVHFGSDKAEDNFFHSDVGIKYSYMGFSMGRKLAKSRSLVTTVGRLESPGLGYDDREVLGFDYLGEKWAVGFLRSNGTGVFSNYQVAENVQVGMRHLRNDYGVHQTGLTVGWKDFSVEFERDSNDLYDDLDDSRIVFTWAKTFGGPKKAKATKFEFLDQGKIATRNIKAAGELSSGTTYDAAMRYRNPIAAAYDQTYKGVRWTKKHDRETGGRIDINPDGTASAGAPVRGSHAAVAIPYTRRTAAIWHTHPGGYGYASENFSHVDFASANQAGVVSFLGTGSWNLKVLVPPSISNAVGLRAGVYGVKNCKGGFMNLRSDYAHNMRVANRGQC